MAAITALALGAEAAHPCVVVETGQCVRLQLYTCQPHTHQDDPNNTPTRVRVVEAGATGNASLSSSEAILFTPGFTIGPAGRPPST